MFFYAHTAPPSDPWEPLFTPFGSATDDPAEACSGQNASPCPHCESLHHQHGHLNKVAHLTAKFSAEMFPEGSARETARQWGFLAGLWHDLGKFSTEFQRYLATASDPHSDEVLQKIDHTTAGAKHAVATSPLGHFIATAIAGHHAGLLDTRHASHASLEKRLSKTFGKEIPNILAPSEITNHPFPPLPDFLKQTSPHFSSSFFQRILFACLVDADFLATEAFMNPAQADLRSSLTSSIFPQALELLGKKIASFGTKPLGDKVEQSRSTVHADCRLAAGLSPGIFTLTVPTGGGKTLSSLGFALRHAIAHGKQRIIYVIPFTSIIEQNASVFNELLLPLGDDVVLEHHSNLSPEKETTSSRLASENWDSPIIVTTAVQFYESLYANKTSHSRKLHNIANSIVILDEAQCLPVNYLTPCLRVLEELSSQYHTTTVLCTATQPSVAKSPDFPIGFKNSTEIIRDTGALFAALARVKINYRGPLADETIADELAKAPQILCIVNTRKHAQTLFEALPDCLEENYHLSTLMCPQHRLQVLSTVRKRLAEELPTRLICTQLIEAGVDIDFPSVYRSMAGLDSIAQAAGRCNREGKLTVGHVHVFHSEHVASERFFAQTANVGHEILDLHATDPLSTSAVQAYFHKYYHQQKDRWDAKDILGEFKYSPSDKKLPLIFNYRTAAENFKLIENTQVPIIIPWDDQSKNLCDNLRNDSIPLHRNLLRGLQRYTVPIHENQFRNNHHQFESIRDGQFNVLICPETHYDENFGLNLKDEAPNAKNLIC